VLDGITEGFLDTLGLMVVDGFSLLSTEGDSEALGLLEGRMEGSPVSLGLLDGFSEGTTDTLGLVVGDSEG